MTRRIVRLAGALFLAAAAGGAVLPAVGHATAAAGEPLSPCNRGQSQNFEMRSTIAFSSTRDNPTGKGVPTLADAGEIYLMSPNGANLRRLTDNQAGDGFALLSPDGKRIVFDSDRLSGQFDISDLFVMNPDGSDPRFLTHGSSASWSPDCKQIVFHASASGTGTPSRTDPGAAASDSDIFVANVDDLLAGVGRPIDITNSPDLIDDDADWSVNGQIAYTAHNVGDDIPNGNGFTSNSANLYLIDADGTGKRQLTDTSYEERAPAWSPDGTRILYACRTGGGTTVFHICVINADGTGLIQLTDGTLTDLPGTWSPDGGQILFNRVLRGGANPMFTIPSQLNPDGSMPTPTQLTCSTTGTCPIPLGGINLFPHWGLLRVHSLP
jgi:Tol biopolymer transport system component